MLLAQAANGRCDGVGVSSDVLCVWGQANYSTLHTDSILAH